jgi:hypothetical protein
MDEEMLKENEELGNLKSNLHFELNSILIEAMKKQDIGRKEIPLLSIDHGQFVRCLNKVSDKNDVSVLTL